MMRAFAKLAARAAAVVAIAAAAVSPVAAHADQTCRIEYLGGADAMVVPDRDVFEHVGAMMPGDESIGAVTVLNSGERPVRLWLWAEEDALGGEDAEHLLGEVIVEIVDVATGAEVYAGPMSPEGARDPIEIGEYAPGESAELACTVTLPSYLGNDHMGRAAGVTWTFAAEELPEGGSSPSAPHTPHAPGGLFGKTGADAGPWALAGILAAALGGGALAASGRRDA